MPRPTEQYGFELTFWIAPWNRDEFLQTAASLALLSDDQPTDSQACFEQLGVEDWFLWRECWDSRPDLERRLRSPTVKTLLGAIEVLGKLERLQALALSDEMGSRAKGAR